jgi:endonuclease/exonuclease/phosphatase family metal-dependent hydrolase
MDGKRRRCALFLQFVAVLALLGPVACGENSRRPVISPDPRDYLFCFWNVENLFDDQEDDRLQGADQEYDRWFARDHTALEFKLARLSQALLEMNGGRGPDIIALAEVENQRAAELLKDALNSRLDNAAMHYSHVLFKDPHGGRHIATAIITRLPVRGDRTRTHGSRLRILEGHIDVNGHDLVVLATHWTSRLTDKTGSQRAKYADQIHGVFSAMYHTNPRVDFLICGDFNDPPEAPSVTEHLHAVDRQQFGLSTEGPRLLDLFAGKDPERYGTHYNQGKWYVFDQIAVSSGLLDDQGWTCDPDSAQTVNNLVLPGDRHRRPWHFGNSHTYNHGYSDHFPVTVRLRVETPAPE